MKYGASRIALSYGIVGLLWITFSDRLLLYIADQDVNNFLFSIANTGKGYFFVVLTGALLYTLIKSDEAQLRQSESQYRHMYEANPNPMWIYDADSLNIISVNDAAIMLYGYSRKEWLSKSILDIRPEEDMGSVASSAKAITDRINVSGTWRHLKKDGTMIYVTITSHKIRFNDRDGVLVMAGDLTDQVAFERKLEVLNGNLENEKQKLSETQLLSKLAGWEYYPVTCKLVWSDELYQITGIARDDSREVFDIYVEHIYPEDRETMIRALQDLILHHIPLDVTHRIRALDGDTRFIRQLAKPESVDGITGKIVGSMQDITELKMLEVEKERYQGHFENTLNSISDAFIALDRNMMVIRINEVFLNMIQRQTDIVGKSIFTIFPKKHNKIYPACQKALAERVIVKLEEYSIILNKWIRLAAYPTDEGVSVYFSAISEHKLKAIELKQAVERFELVSHATKDVIYDLDVINNKLVYNTSLSQLVNIPVEEIKYTLEWWRSLIHPDDLSHVASSQEKSKRDGKMNWACEYRINCGPAGYKYIMDQGYFVFDDDKHPVRLIGAIKDINELKRTGQENKRLADIITRVNNMIIVTDDQHRVTWVNNAFEDLTGFKLSSISNRTPFELLNAHEVAQDDRAALLYNLERRVSFISDLVIYTHLNQPISVSAEFTPLYEENHVYKGYIAVYQNITVRKEKEQQIERQNQFLKDVAWLSSHKMRRPVASLLGLVDLLYVAKTQEEWTEILPMLRQSTAEMDQIVREIAQKLDDAVHLKASDWQ